MLGGWLLVLVLATSLTWQIVSAADDQVSEGPIAPLNVDAPGLTDLQTTTSAAVQAPSTGPGSTSTTPPVGSTVTPPPTEGTSPSGDDEWQTRAVQTTGGTVLIRYRPGEVAYQSATPTPGFQVEVAEKGPPEVKVKFESESEEIEVEAAWKDGRLEVKTSGGGEGED